MNFTAVAAGDWAAVVAALGQVEARLQAVERAQKLFDYRLDQVVAWSAGSAAVIQGEVINVNSGSQ